jgi:uncharacterized protein
MEIIYEATVGSKLYGISNENSDTDIKSVHFRDYADIVPSEYNYFGLTHTKKDEVVNKDNGLTGSAKIESVSYSVKKFVELAMKGNPTLLEIAFVPTYLLLINTPIAQEIMEYVRKNFITKKALKAYIGYFLDQKKNNINTPKKKCHAYRIGVQALNFAETGIINPVLSGAQLETAMHIREHTMIDESVGCLLDSLDSDLRKIETTNNLPEEPDEQAASDFLVYIHKKYYALQLNTLAGLYYDEGTEF